MEKIYRIQAPLGVEIIPKEHMTEKELRDFALSTVRDSQEAEIWREKVIKDPIDSIVEWLQNLEYVITSK